MEATLTHRSATRPAIGHPLLALLVLGLHRLDAWLERRARHERDHDDLAQMSERELRDIGLGAGFRDDVASGRWTNEVR